jgi:hypothetical protein
MWIDNGNVILYWWLYPDQWSSGWGGAAFINYYSVDYLAPILREAMGDDRISQSGYKPGNNTGIVYYSYNGTGSVYFSENVFYLCSSGRPAGYVEGGTIYDFSGRVLGFYENRFIYDKNGNPVGADDPKRLGTDAAVKRSVSKANKQDVPAKQPKDSVKKPRLKNAYVGGTLQNVFQ